MFESWSRDLEEENEFARNYAIFGGSFVNPELAQKMIKQENPDHQTSDEDFEKLSQEMVAESKRKQENNKPRRGRRNRKLIQAK